MMIAAQALKAIDGGCEGLHGETGRKVIAPGRRLESGRDARLCPGVCRTWARRAGLYEPAGEILP